MKFVFTSLPRSARPASPRWRSARLRLSAQPIIDTDPLPDPWRRRRWLGRHRAGHGRGPHQVAGLVGSATYENMSGGGGGKAIAHSDRDGGQPARHADGQLDPDRHPLAAEAYSRRASATLSWLRPRSATMVRWLLRRMRRHRRRLGDLVAAFERGRRASCRDRRWFGRRRHGSSGRCSDHEGRRRRPDRR